MQDFFRARLANGIATIVIDDGKFALNPLYDRDHSDGLFGGHVGTVEELGGTLKWYGGDGSYCASPFHSGEFHPRIWRGNESPSPEEAGIAREWIISVRIGRQLFGRLRELFGYIEPHPQNDLVHGMQQRELLILACTEVESAWKSILKTNGLTQDRWTTTDYVKLLKPLRLAEWSVRLSSHPDYPTITPFQSWNEIAPTKSLGWYDAYNSVKHDRENGMQQATFANVIHAMAAVYIMTVSQFGTSHVNDSTPFHPDEFRIASMPSWELDELYICPLRDREKWLGHEKWTPMKYLF